MPELQIDGVLMAVIDQTLADDIRHLVALHGVGRNYRPSRIDHAIKFRLPAPQAKPETYALTLEFPSVLK
jgi:hypothetical protein